MENRETIRGRVILCTLSLVIIFGVLITIFWSQQLQFLRPTPRPINFQEVALGTQPDLSQWNIQPEQQISLLHFYNPDCPCSRFNLDHFRDLVSTYEEKVGFYVILQSANAQFDEDWAKGRVRVVLDTDGSIADRCGVYATPQAVVIDQNGSIIYRGNYNRARFCSSKDSWFTKMVIENELGVQPSMSISKEAFMPYGCTLPSDKDEILKIQAGLADKLKQLIN